MASAPKLSDLPAGYASEYRGDGLRDTMIAFTVLEIVFVTLRYLSQRVGNKKLGMDDWLMIPALIFCLGFNLCAIISIHMGGIGYHEAVVMATHPEAVVVWLKIAIAGSTLYVAAVSFPRIVLLTMYLRIFITKPFRISAYVMIAILVSWIISCAIASALECIPLPALWNPSIKGKCIDIAAFYRYGALPSPIIDVAMLIMPIPVIWKLQVSRRIRLGLTLTFLTGSIGMVVAVVRSVYYFHYEKPDVDTTWTNVPFQTWCIVESGCYLIAACLPRYVPVLNYISNGKFDPTSHNSSTSQGIHQLKDLVTRKKKSRDTGFASLEEGNNGSEKLISAEQGSSQAWKSVQISQFATPRTIAVPEPAKRSGDHERVPI